MFDDSSFNSCRKKEALDFSSGLRSPHSPSVHPRGRRPAEATVEAGGAALASEVTWRRP